MITEGIVNIVRSTPGISCRLHDRLSIVIKANRAITIQITNIIFTFFCKTQAFNLSSDTGWKQSALLKNRKGTTNNSKNNKNTGKIIDLGRNIGEKIVENIEYNIKTKTNRIYSTGCFMHLSYKFITFK